MARIWNIKTIFINTIQWDPCIWHIFANFITFKSKSVRVPGFLCYIFACGSSVWEITLVCYTGHSIVMSGVVLLMCFLKWWTRFRKHGAIFPSFLHLNSTAFLEILVHNYEEGNFVVIYKIIFLDPQIIVNQFSPTQMLMRYLKVIYHNSLLCKADICIVEHLASLCTHPL